MDKTAIILQHVEEEGPGILADMLQERGWEQKVVHLYKGDSIPDNWQESGLAIIMGGPMNVNEETDYPFLKKEKEFIRQALAKGFPLLGICLGGQLIARALGAGVYRGTVKEIGWYRVQLTPEGRMAPLLGHFPPDFVVFQWHEDTMYLPDRAIHLITSDRYHNQAFCVGEWIYAFQFHLEVTQKIIETWLCAGGVDLISSKENISPEKILSETPLYINKIHTLCRHFFFSFLKKIEQELLPATKDTK